MLAASTLFDLSERTALVTGGATGIGRICAEALLSAGARVLIASRKAEACEAAAKELSAIGPCEGFGGTVATEAGVAALAAEMRSRTSNLHVLVNNAGLTWGAPFETYPWKAFDRIMSVNVAGLFVLTRDLAPVARGFGHGGSAVGCRQHRLGDGRRHPVGKLLGLLRLEGRRASPDADPRGRVRAAAGDGQRHCAGTVSDPHDPLRPR